MIKKTQNTIAESPRLMFIERISQAVQEAQLVILSGSKGLNQKATIAAALGSGSDWECLHVSGNWQSGGYLAGFQELIDEALAWCATNDPEIISRYEQSLKRILPRYDSPHFQVPKDLTNTSSKEERTRFYHHEYQNKLLVGLAEFLLEYLRATTPKLLIIDYASSMSPTATNLLKIFLRIPSSSSSIKFVLIDYENKVFIPQGITINISEYSYDEMVQLLKLDAHYSPEKSRKIFTASRGNAMLARAVVACEQFGIPVVGVLDARAMVDFYLAAIGDTKRRELWLQYVAKNCESEDYIEIRNYETFDFEFADNEHQQRHRECMAQYEAGNAPLITLHAQAIRDKYKRLEALVEPSEILKGIGLYDTWFSYFAELFADPDLRRYGSGDDPANGVFINAAFVLYSLGCGKVSAPYLDEFRLTFPQSKFIPTALYAQSMTYGRYEQPVNLPLAEQYALLNIETIKKDFKDYEKYHYIKVFAENAYAYIKARQGKYQEALELCTNGNLKMLEIYGEDKFKLHQSILIYNTSQVYEIIKNYELAEAQLRLAISYDPFYGEYHNDLGNLLSKIPGREGEALDAYQRAIDLCPPYYEAHLNRGMLHAALGNYSAAVKDFDRVLEIKPEEWRAFLELGNVHLIRGEYTEALRAYHKALAIEQSSVDLFCNMALAYSESEDKENSVTFYRRALTLNPRHGPSNNNLAIELFQLGRVEEAVMHAAAACEVSNDPDYQTNLDLFSQTLQTS